MESRQVINSLQDTHSSSRAGLYLLVVMFAAAVIRLITITTRGIWYDDAFSLFLAEKPLSMIISGTAADTMPPLYYFLLHFWMKAGSGIAWARLLNFLLSLGIVFFVYLWVRDLAGSNAGVWAAVMAAVSPIIVYHALEIRMYSLLTLSLAGYAWFSTRMSQERGENWLNLTAVIACGTAAMYSHNLAVFTLVVPPVLFAMQKKWHLMITSLAGLAGIFILSLPWLVYVPGQVAKIQAAFWTPRPGVVEIIQAVTAMVTNLPLKEPFLALAVLFSLQIFIVLVYIYIRRRKWNQASRTLFAYTFIPPLLLFAASYLMRPVFVPRAFILSGISLYALAACLAADRITYKAGRILAGGLILLAVLGLIPQYLFNEFPRSPFQEAARQITASIQPGEVVVHDNKLSAFPMIYYRPDLPQVFIDDEPGGHNDTYAPASRQAIGLYPVPNITQAAGDASRIYFVVFQKAIDEYIEAGEPNHPVLTYLDNHYRLSELWVTGDMSIYLYDINN